jgi:hypothetical protein
MTLTRDKRPRPAPRALRAVHAVHAVHATRYRTFPSLVKVFTI